MALVQIIITDMQLSPPTPKAPCRMSHPEVGIQYDPIRAIIAAIPKLEVAEEISKRIEIKSVNS
jgi:hypothetical protein